MRLWHKDLIPVLPRKQLMGQWLECNILINKLNQGETIKHIIVKRVLDYPLNDFLCYVASIYNEMINRNYSPKKITLTNCSKIPSHFFNNENSSKSIFKDWHNKRYLLQCYYNLQEKYDCGGIDENEWTKISSYLNLKK